MLQLVAMLVLSGPLAQFHPDPNDPTYQDEWRLMHLAQSAWVYSDKHNGQMPPDMAAMVEVLGPDKSVSQAIRDSFMAPGISGVKVPDDAKADWVNKNSTYEQYLGGEGIEVNDVPDWGEVVPGSTSNSTRATPQPSRPPTQKDGSSRSHSWMGTGSSRTRPTHSGPSTIPARSSKRFAPALHFPTSSRPPGTSWSS